MGKYMIKWCSFKVNFDKGPVKYISDQIRYELTILFNSESKK